MQVICTSLQSDNHASTSSLEFFMGWMLFLGLGLGLGNQDLGQFIGLGLGL